MNNIIFKQRWKEELMAIDVEGTLIFELTIGQLHLYFPDKERWIETVPTWATGKWEYYLEACTEWCKTNKIPISIVPDAHVYAEQNSG